MADRRFLRRGANLEFGPKDYYRKLHENETNRTGGHVPAPPPIWIRRCFIHFHVFNSTYIESLNLTVTIKHTLDEGFSVTQRQSCFTKDLIGEGQKILCFSATASPSYFKLFTFRPFGLFKISFWNKGPEKFYFGPIFVKFLTKC